MGALLAGPVGWLVIGYLGSLAVLLVTAFWSVDALSGEVEQGFRLRKLRNAARRTGLPRHRRSARSASPPLVTITDAILAFPIAFYMAKVAAAAARRSSSSRSCCRSGRATWSRSSPGARCSPATASINWALEPFGLHGPGYGIVAVWLVMSYLWLPYMILPIYAGLERIPNSLISASEDLGAHPSRPSAG